MADGILRDVTGRRDIRQALADDRLGGFHLPRGWLAFVIPYVLHRLPAFWRPITAIRLGDTDGNPQTEVDST